MRAATVSYQKQINTPDREWFMSADRVTVSYCEYSDKTISLSVWGPDDIGMTLDFPKSDRQIAKKLYEKIVDGTTVAQLRQMGLYQF